MRDSSLERPIPRFKVSVKPGLAQSDHRRHPPRQRTTAHTSHVPLRPTNPSRRTPRPLHRLQSQRLRGRCRSAPTVVTPFRQPPAAPGRARKERAVLTPPSVARLRNAVADLDLGHAAGLASLLRRSWGFPVKDVLRRSVVREKAAASLGAIAPMHPPATSKV